MLVYAKALLTSHPLGVTDHVDANLRDPDTILREAARTLDFTQPVALVLCGILAHLPSYDEARATVRRLMADLPAGSHLMVADGTNTSETFVDAINIWNQSAEPPYDPRSPEQIASYFEGLDLVGHGVVPVNHWHLEPRESGLPSALDGHVGVGRKS